MIHENLKGRVAVVTGGGGVLCSAFSKTLAKKDEIMNIFQKLNFN